MPASEVYLASLFSAVTKTLQENQVSLNDADEYNHNHGDNMVNNFKLITKATQKKKGAPPSEQLSYASETLQKNSKSGSARLYSQGLSQAASQLEGQEAVTSRNALSLVQALLGGQPSSPSTQAGTSDLMGQLMGSLVGGGATPPPDNLPENAQGADLMGGLMGALMGNTGAGQTTPQPSESQGADLLDGLLGSLMGSGEPASPSQQQAGSQGSDLLGGLMGALLGGGATGMPSPTGQSSQGTGGMDLNTLLGIGSALMQSNQQGSSPVSGLVNALLSGSQVNNSPHHSQSGQLVASTLINTLGAMLGGKSQ